RADVIAPSPELDLLATPLADGFGLVQTLEIPVHALVERLVPLDGDAADAGFFERERRGVGGALQDRREEHVDPPAAKLPAGGPPFRFALRRERDVDPAREAVLEVPLRLAVTEENQLGHDRRGLYRDSAPSVTSRRLKGRPSTGKRPAHDVDHRAVSHQLVR